VLRASRKRYALVVGSEQLSRLLSMEDRNTAVLFGDGAGACIVELLPEDAGIENGTRPLYEALLGSRGSDVILAPGCYGTTPVDHMLMDGKEVFLFAVKTIPEVLEALLEKSGLALEDLDYVVCHQANARIIRNVVRKLHAREEQFFMNMETYGNTSGASIPMALAEMKQKNLLKHGAKLALIGFGAGLTYGGALLTVR
jgi:3-oxoacyl-[acyl-carrier-protein] synthase-3